MTSGIQVTGAAQLKEALEQALRNMSAAVACGLYTEAWNIMTKAKRVTPKDFGTLRGSAFVSLPEMESGKPMVRLGFGGPAGAYAINQHERTDVKNYTEPGTGNQFLATPIANAQAGLSGRVAKLAGASFRQGQTTPTNLGPVTPQGTAPTSSQRAAHRKAKIKAARRRARRAELKAAKAAKAARGET